MRKVVISGTGMAVPDQIIPNSYFDESLGENVSEWLEENVHIYHRRWCKEDESTSTLCVSAVEKILLSSGKSPKDIDLLIICTDTPEYISPSTSSKVQDLTGMVNAGTFDINTACAGFVTGLDIGSKYIQSDLKYNNVMVIGAYAMSKHLNKSDKKTVTLFADGAAGVLLSSSEDSERGFLGSELRSKGQYCDWMGIYGGGTFQPSNQEVIKQKNHQLKFVKKFPPELNPNTWSDMATQLANDINIDLQEVDHFFITQININSIWATMDLIGIDRSKAHTVMHEYGYTGSACIPMALQDAIENGKVKKGDLCFFIGSGGGLSFASAAFKF